MKKITIKNLLEEQFEQDKARELYDDVLEFIRVQLKRRKMSYDEGYEFHEMLKKWVNRWI